MKLSGGANQHQPPINVTFIGKRRFASKVALSNTGYIIYLSGFP